MLEQRNWRVLLILFILFNERTSTNGVQRTLQSDYSPPQFLAARKNSTLQGHAHSLKMKTEREHYKNPSINQANHEGPLSILKTINVIHRRHVFVASIERSSRIQRDLGTTSAEPEQAVETNPEPEPDWPSALKTWGKAWDQHIYLFAVLYVLIAATSGIGLAHDVLTNHSIKGLKLSLYLTLLFLGCSRSIILFVDPYCSRGILGFFGTYITWSLGFPCVLTALGLLLLVFVEVTKMDIAPPRFQKLSTALGVMVINVIIILVTDLVFLLTQKALALLIICHVYFLLLGLTLTAGFLRVGFQISNNSAANIYGDTGLKRLRMLAFIAAALNLLFLGVQLCSIIQSGVRLGTPRAWSWYAVQTSLRALEVSMCVVMFFIVFNNRVGSSAACWRNFLPNRSRNTVHVLPFSGPKSIDEEP